MVKSYSFEINLKNWQNKEKNPYIHILPLTHLFMTFTKFETQGPRFQDAQMIRPKNLRG